jgi:hypothetical protein
VLGAADRDGREPCNVADMIDRSRPPAVSPNVAAPGGAVARARRASRPAPPS